MSPGAERGSGDAAIDAAARRASRTRTRNLAQLPGLPGPADTANLREGPDLHPSLLALLPLVGVWRGTGEASHPSISGHRFGQQIVVGHDGREFLTWESRLWVLTDDDHFVGPGARESGFWRVQAREDGEDTLELLLAHSSGVVELFYGAPISQAAWELGTDVVIRSSSGAEVAGAKRLYGVVEDGDLAWVEERVIGAHELQPHLSAKLTRYAG